MRYLEKVIQVPPFAPSPVGPTSWLHQILKRGSWRSRLAHLKRFAFKKRAYDRRKGLGKGALFEPVVIEARERVKKVWRNL